jgi:hypothetical protein
MSLGFLGRTTAYVGIILGLLALGLPLVENGVTVRYIDDGTAFAFLVFALSYASYLPAEIGRDLPAAAVGAAALGFYLWWPAYLAFDRLGLLGAGGWLGLCTVLIPIGWLMVRRAEAHGAATQSGTTPSQAALGAIALGGLLVLVGIWLPAFSDGGDPSSWDLSATLGILMLLLVLVTAVLTVAMVTSAPGAADLALLVAATTFGLVAQTWIHAAFENFGNLGAGSWLLAIGGLVMVVGVAAVRRAVLPAHAPESVPAPAAQ